MIGVVWALAVVTAIAIIMFGIYQCFRITDNNTLEIRELKRKLTLSEASRLEQAVIITRLEADLETEKNKVHNADEVP